MPCGDTSRVRKQRLTWSLGHVIVYAARDRVRGVLISGREKRDATAHTTNHPTEASEKLMEHAITEPVARKSLGPLGALVDAMALFFPGMGVASVMVKLLAEAYGMSVTKRLTLFGEHLLNEQGRAEKAGRRLRADWFSSGDIKPEGQEVAERTLMLVRDDPEQQKLPYLARLLTSITHPDHPSEQRNHHEAHQLLMVFLGVTYRQLCIMAIAQILQVRRGEGPRRERDEKRVWAAGEIAKFWNLDSLRDKPWNTTTGSRTFDDEFFLLEDCLELHRRGLLGVRDGAITWNIGDIIPAEMGLSNFGDFLVRMCGVEFPDDDILPLVKIFARWR